MKNSPKDLLWLPLLSHNNGFLVITFICEQPRLPVNVYVKVEVFVFLLNVYIFPIISKYILLTFYFI